MKRALRILGGALALALGLYFAWLAVPVLPSADLALLDDPRVWAAVILAAACYALIIPISAWAWGGLLRHYGSVPRWSALCSIMARTQLAKYVPGNVAQHAMRLALSLRAGVRPDAFTGTVVQETLLAMAASVGVGVAAMLLAGRHLHEIMGDRTMIPVLAASLVGVTLVAFALYAGSRLRPDQTASESMAHRALRYLGIIDTRDIARCLFAYAANFVVIGVGLAALARAVGMPAEVDFAAVTGAFALSWVLGFLAPGAPAGIGVREGIMALLLAGAAPQDQLVTFVLLARLATIAGDTACFTIGSCVMKPVGDYR